MTRGSFYDTMVTVRHRADRTVTFTDSRLLSKENLMIAFSLTNIKDFTSHLLVKDTFDSFSFIEGEIVTYNTFRRSGMFLLEKRA